MDDGGVGRCAGCGGPLDPHDHNIRYQLPDAIWDIPEVEREGRMWGTSNSPMVSLEGIGGFIRALLAIGLTDGLSLTYGTWLSVTSDVLDQAWEVWRTDQYERLAFEGQLGNALPPWGEDVLGKACSARVVEPDELPVIVGADDALLSRIISETWPQEDILPHVASRLVD